jgi:hypothetical protein
LLPTEHNHLVTRGRLPICLDIIESFPLPWKSLVDPVDIKIKDLGLQIASTYKWLRASRLAISFVHDYRSTLAPYSKWPRSRYEPSRRDWL